MLLAERGKFDEAISLFEAAEKDHLLSAADYRVLANWYLISNRREAYERSQIEAFKMLPEQVLSNMFYRLRNYWCYSRPLQNVQPLPTELDKHAVRHASAFRKIGPAGELSVDAARAIRSLPRFPPVADAAHAVVGRSPQQIYPFLATLQNQILGEIHNEATTDEIIATINKLRDGKLTSTDLRALDLFEAIIERRASEVLILPRRIMPPVWRRCGGRLSASGVMANRG